MTFSADVERVYLWCRVEGAPDTTEIRHVWYHDGKEMAVVSLPVKSSSWRTWSSKKILPGWIGNWEVRVVGADGGTLATVPFEVIPAEP